MARLLREARRDAVTVAVASSSASRCASRTRRALFEHSAARVLHSVLQAQYSFCARLESIPGASRCKDARTLLAPFGHFVCARYCEFRAARATSNSSGAATATDLSREDALAIHGHTHGRCPSTARRLCRSICRDSTPRISPAVSRASSRERRLNGRLAVKRRGEETASRSLDSTVCELSLTSARAQRDPLLPGPSQSNSKPRSCRFVC